MAEVKRAVIFGIDDYAAAPLSGCVNDALNVAKLLARHANGTPNFECGTFTSRDYEITRSFLKDGIEKLFSPLASSALLYFSGHGTATNLGGYLVTQDAQRFDEGLSMTDILALANKSTVPEIVIVLDCCYSGKFGQVPMMDNNSCVLREGLTILTASHGSQLAYQRNGSSLFTALFCAALEGGAADVLGKVTVANSYAYIDQSLGSFEQRPLFMAHLTTVTTLRQAEPTVDPAILRKLPEYFPAQDDLYPLDESYEPEVEPHVEKHEAIFAEFQKCRAARLLEPVGEDHLYWAAMRRKSCRLTPLGKFIWSLAKQGRI
jgi:hypothetical protein